MVWSKTGGSLPGGASPYDNQLVLENIREEDAGEYVCTASDLSASARASAQIRVTRGGILQLHLLVFVQLIAHSISRLID